MGPRRRQLIACLLLIGACLAVVKGHADVWDDDEDDDFEDFDKKEAVNAIRNDKFVQDREHVAEHLKNRASIDIKDSSAEEIEFHFFLNHDFDGNQLLDGLELYHSVEHGSIPQLDRIDKNEHYSERTKIERRAKVYERLTNTIDRILLDDDLDKDGYLSYTEFAKARHASRTLKTAAAAASM